MKATQALELLEDKIALINYKSQITPDSDPEARRAWQTMRDLERTVPELLQIIVDKKDVQCAINVQWHIIKGLEPSMQQVVQEHGTPRDMCTLLMHTTKHNHIKPPVEEQALINAIADGGDPSACLDVMIHVTKRPSKILMNAFFDIVSDSGSLDENGNFNDPHALVRLRALAWLKGLATKEKTEPEPQKNTLTTRKSPAYREQKQTYVR